MTDFNYKKYSLEKLEEWMYDAMSSAEATPQEIYDVIKGVVEENYYTYKHQTSQAYELLALLNGNGKGHIKDYDDFLNSKKEPLSCDKDNTSSECKGAWTSFWEENYYPEEYKGSTVSSVSNVMPPWGHSDMEALKYTDEELNAMCEKAASDEEKEKCREYNLREAEYYNKRAQVDADYEKSKYCWDSDRNKSITELSYDEAIASGWEMTTDGFWIPPQKEDKLKKWQLPVEMDPSGEFFVLFPDDLLEAANLKEGDNVEWVDNKDGSYIIRKVTKEIKMEEC
jgi:hypothetical protein